jgi:hypothetical protein
MKHPHVLAVTESGTPFQFLHWQDAIVQKCKGNISYEMGSMDEFFGGLSRMTGERSHVEIGSIVFIKGKFKHNTKVPALTNLNLFRRDLGICAYCAKHYSESHLTRDHIVPSSKGGTDTWMNCVASCKKCNSKKGNKTLDEVGMELIYVPYIPNKQEVLILQNRNILADQMEFLSSFLPEHSRAHKFVEMCK